MEGAGDFVHIQAWKMGTELGGGLMGAAEFCGVPRARSPQIAILFTLLVLLTSIFSLHSDIRFPSSSKHHFFNPSIIHQTAHISIELL